MTVWKLEPDEIERRSFEIIDAEAGQHGWPEAEWTVVRRMVHTSADFDYVRTARFHPRAVESGLAAIRAGRPIVTDTRMARAGISTARLAPFGVRVDCFIASPEAAEAAGKAGATRAAAAVDLWLERVGGGIYVIGNAPTALFRLIEHIDAGRVAPDLVVGLPVGFVNAAESKAALVETDVPYVTALGRKGGSNVAASVINALTALAAEEV